MTPETDRELLIRIDERTRQMHDTLHGEEGLKKRVSSLETSRDQGRGMLIVIGLLWAALWASVEAWFHHR